MKVIHANLQTDLPGLTLLFNQHWSSEEINFALFGAKVPYPEALYITDGIRPIGLTASYLKTTDYGEFRLLSRLVVDKYHRGKNLATNLMYAFTARLDEYGEASGLEVVREKPWLIDFYRKFGYAEGPNTRQHSNDLSIFLERAAG